MCVWACLSAVTLEAEGGHQALGAGATEGSEAPDSVLGTYLRACAGAADALCHWANSSI